MNMMRRSEAIDLFAASFAKAQGEMSGATKEKVNPAFKSRYADLASAHEACREALTKHGLSYLQTAIISAAGVFSGITTTILHSSGQWVEGDFPISPVKNDPQGIGSAATYGRRYGLMAMVGIAPEDDDGEAAMGRQQPANTQQPAQRPAQFDAAKQDAALKQSQERTAENLIDQITKVATSDALSDLWKANAELIKALPEHLKSDVRAAASARKELLTGDEEAA
jgi:hypothetical protein